MHGYTMVLRDLTLLQNRNLVLERCRILEMDSTASEALNQNPPIPIL